MHFEAKSSKNANKKKVKRRKGKLVKKVYRGKHVMMYKVIGRKSRLVVRGSYPRIAK